MHFPGSFGLNDQRPEGSDVTGAGKTASPSPDRSVSYARSSCTPVGPVGSVYVRAFQSEDAEAFRKLNEAWILHWFTLEPEDVKLLSDPEEHILARGGQIFMAVSGEEAIGCFALLPIDGDVLRLIRMTVREDQRGRGVGRMLLLKAIEVARARSAPKLVLETSRKLESAVHLYEAAGFRQVAVDPSAGLPLARADLYMELLLSYG